MNRPIIDVHAHWGPWFFPMDVGDVSTNLRLMDEWGITLQLVSAVEGVTYDPAAGNAALARILPAQPRLRGYVVANPRSPGRTAADIARYGLDGPFVGVKIHTDYTASPIDSPQMRETFALLNDHAARILIHTWGGPAVFALRRLVDDNPRVRVIAAHMGGDRWDLAAEAAQGCSRLYLEPSCSVTDAGQVAHVAGRVERSQLLFGTDATLIDPAVSFGLVEAAGLPDPVADALYWRNAAELFDLAEDVAALAPAATPGGITERFS